MLAIVFGFAAIESHALAVRRYREERTEIAHNSFRGSAQHRYAVKRGVGVAFIVDDVIDERTIRRKVRAAEDSVARLKKLKNGVGVGLLHKEGAGPGRS